MGAGVIPFCRHQGRVLFLLSRSFDGRKVGFLNDFGGGIDPGEDYRQTAIREFVEETETMFFETRLSEARRTPERIAAQVSILQARFAQTLDTHPHWWCQRNPGHKQPPRDWRTFFIELDYRDVGPLNAEWAADALLDADQQRFSRRRELRWVPADELLMIYHQEPKRLWKRVRQLQGATEVIEDILRQNPRSHAGAWERG